MVEVGEFHTEVVDNKYEFNVVRDVGAKARCVLSRYVDDCCQAALEFFVC